ncbi:MAG: HupE/UreJ family protein [Leadbetterella sp.]|nr:HupE/UreJ family protein [Leadbetterella sp.]
MDIFSLYFELGWQHILDLGGYDHILFVAALCGIYTLSDWKKVLILVTAFTIGHSVALALSVLDIVRVSSGLIEFLIPLSIVITALGNIFRGRKEGQGFNYAVAAFFGLIHGMGFSNYLRSLLGGESDLVVPLLGFNVGLEFGQVIIVLVVLLIAQLAIKYFKVSRRDWNIFLSSAIFGIALIMCIERTGSIF